MFELNYYYRVDYEYCNHKTFVIFLNKSEVDGWLNKHKWNKKYKVLKIERYQAI